MKNQIALPANQAKQSRISLWLNRENVLFSSITYSGAYPFTFR